MYVGLGIIETDTFQKDWLERDEVLIVEGSIGLVCLPADPENSLEQVQNYTQSLCQLIKKTTIIPLRFGTLFDREDDVKKVLLDGVHHYNHLLRNFYNTFEIELKLSWKKEIFAQEMLKDKRLARWKKAIESGKGQGYDVVEFGQAVQEVTDSKRNLLEKEILKLLRPIAKKFIIKECVEEYQAFNGVFLIERSREDEFDQAVDGVYNKFGQDFIFNYTGPWPPHHFVE